MGANSFVYFDLGNVLVTFDHQVAVRQLAQLAGRSHAAVQEVVFESNLQNRYETGQVTSEEFAAEINSQLQTKLDRKAILEAISAIFQVNEPILPILERLRQQNVPLGLLSNTCSAHWNWILDQAWPIPSNWFQHHVLSFEVGCMKPDSGIYEFSEQQTSGERLFFTDDRAENIAAAESRGWTTHLFRDARELWADLEVWLS